MRFLLVTGLSGAGKTAVNRCLEDMGAFCVDNLPPNMLIKMMEAFEQSNLRCPMVVMAVDARSAEMFDAKTVCDLIAEAQALGYSIETLFLEARKDALVSRYKETRREHPLSDDAITLTDAIAREKEMMQPLRETANYIIDTTHLKPRQLHGVLSGIVGEEAGIRRFRVELSSFGFKRGLPHQADLVFDVRFLPNPFYIEGLGRHTGLDEDVRAFVMEDPVTIQFMQKLKDMLLFLLPHYQAEGKSRLAIGIGCTGGAHRSVAITEAVGAFLQESGYQVSIDHRDLALEQAHWKTLTEG